MQFGGRALKGDADVSKGGSCGGDALFVGVAFGVSYRALAEIAIAVTAQSLTDIHAGQVELAEFDDAARGSFGFGGIGKTQGGLAARERKTVFARFAFGVVEIALGFVALLETVPVDASGVGTARNARSTRALITIGALVEIAGFTGLWSVVACFDICPFSASIVALRTGLFGLLGTSGTSDLATIGVGSTELVFAVVSCTALPRPIARFGHTKTVLASLSIPASFRGFPHNASFTHIAPLDAIGTRTTACDRALGRTFGTWFGGYLGRTFYTRFGLWFGGFDVLGFFCQGRFFRGRFRSIEDGFKQGFLWRRGWASE